MKAVYLVRHCRAAGQSPDVPLTHEGFAQAERLADFLAPVGVEQIVSSPYVRAVQSVTPLARRLGLPLETDERFGEWVLAGEPVPDYLTAIQAAFADPSLSYPGGETGAALTERAMAGLEAVRQHPAKVTVVALHGGILSHLLRRFIPGFGFNEWQKLTNPDVYLLTVGNRETCIRVWDTEVKGTA